MTDAFMRSLVNAVNRFFDSLREYEAWRDSIDRPLGPPYRPPSSRLKRDDSHGFIAIQRTDPAFNLAEFLVRVGEMFLAYHAALDRGELAPVKRFIDEWYYPTVKARASKQGRSPEGARPLEIRTIRPATAQHEDGMDLMRVSIVANQGGAEPRVVSEYWELIRKRGTLTKPGLDVTRCPDCGGPANGDDPAHCGYCGTRLADPALDWVVCKITEQ